MPKTHQEEFTVKNIPLRITTLAAVAAIGVMATPVVASASTNQQATGNSARQDVAAVSVPGAPKAHTPEQSNEWVNCDNGSFGTSGGQWYFEIACSLIDATSWSANVGCSNGYYYTAGPFETYENVQVYCPVGTVAEEGWVSYTT
jgi:hypothetical protein